MKVSIIVACYNQEKYLSDAIESILASTYKNWETIIIDDGSSDNSANIANKYTSTHDNIKYLYQKNQGVCVARNNAIKSSSGEYILCLDADDKISPKYIGLCVQELDNDEFIKLVTCNYQYFGKSHIKVNLEPYSIEKLMGHNLFINCSMFRRKDFDRVNGFNENMKLGLEDWDLWLNILKDGGNVKYLNGRHFYYRIKNNNESRNLSLAHNNHDELRKQIWMNHKDLYSRIYTSPLYSHEFRTIAESKEYKIGKFIMSSIRFIQNLPSSLFLSK